MESKSNLVKAILSVMKSVKNVEKNMEVGSGKSSYKGVSDKDVKEKIGKAMAENGLALIPIDVDSKIHIDRWTEKDYNGNDKSKQSVTAEVKTKYLLIHESGESIEVAGYGHGVDSQDKAAGKATTYALKYALLYMFLVPTGQIDDADNTHSDEIPTPKKNAISLDVIKGQLLTFDNKDQLNEYYSKLGYTKENPAPPAILSLFAERKGQL